MTRDRIAAELMQQIVADPDDDTPRLVMADWYDEQADPRGELIRAQCELEHLDWLDPRFDELEKVVEQLISKHRAKWVKQLPKLPGITWGNFNVAFHEATWDGGRRFFRRGFIELVAIKDYKSHKKHVDALRDYGLACYPEIVSCDHRCYRMLYDEPYVRGLGFYQQFSGIDFDQIATMTSRERLSSLAMVECRLDKKEAEIFTSLDLPSLRMLDLHFNDLDDSIDTLCKWPAMKQLRGLNFGLNGLGDENGKLSRLMSEPTLKQLSFLSLWGNRLTAQHLQTAADPCKIDRLMHLDFSSNPFGDDGVIALLEWPIESIRSLDLSHVAITGASGQALANSRKLSNLRQLNIGHNSALDDAAAVAIAASESLANLTHLNFARTQFGETGAQALIESTTLKSIRHLNIGDAELEPKTLKMLQRRYPKAIKKDAHR
ncbi:MAG: TIGR02996 domain-containing protein [Planctomycetota bacterium]